MDTVRYLVQRTEQFFKGTLEIQQKILLLYALIHCRIKCTRSIEWQVLLGRSYDRYKAKRNTGHLRNFFWQVTFAKVKLVGWHILLTTQIPPSLSVSASLLLPQVCTTYISKVVSWLFETSIQNLKIPWQKKKNKNKKNELVTSHSRSNTGIFTFRNFYIVHKIFWANLFLCRCDAHLKTEVSNKLQKCSCSFIFLHCLCKKCSVQVPFCTDVRKAHWGRLLPEVYPWPHGIQTTASIWFCR